jgi:hypothetical protein
MLGARIFVILSATFIVCGWALSAVGTLSLFAYILATPVVFWSLWHFSTPTDLNALPFWKIHLARYKRLPAAIFGVITLLCLIGAILHAPSNYDYLTYRLPRLLHWHEVGAWHWIISGNSRMNVSAANTEWISSPLFLLTQSDRLLFLPSFIAFLLLPGAVFITFRGLGIKSRAAWWAMWLVPTAYGYVSQAGSAGNDLLGTTFFVIAMAFLFRAYASKCTGWFILSVFAVAICTGVKATNLPLLAPWGIAAIPVLCKAKLRWSRVAAAAPVALVCSFAPMAVLNHIHAGNWKGKGPGDEALEAGSLAGGIVGNSAAVAAGAIQPPLLPVPRPVSEAINQALPDKIKTLLQSDFPRLKLHLVELPNEENAGLGLGLLALIAASFMGIAFTCRRGPWLSRHGTAIVCAAFFATLVYMSTMASESAARLLLPYYPILLAVPFSAAGAHRLFNFKLWRGIALAAAISALAIPLLTPSRPLVPVAALAEFILWAGPLTQRIQSVYAVYSQRSDNLAAVREILPEHAQRIGFLASEDDIEVSLWRPFGGRRSVAHLTPEEGTLPLVDAIVLSTYSEQRWPEAARRRLRTALDPYHKAGSVFVTSKVRQGSVEWIVYLQDPEPHSFLPLVP